MTKIKPKRIICTCPKCGSDELEFAWLWSKESETYKQVKKCFRCPKCRTVFKSEDTIFEHESIIDRKK